MREYAGISDPVDKDHPSEDEKQDVRDEKRELVEDGNQEDEIKKIDGSVCSRGSDTPRTSSEFS